MSTLTRKAAAIVISSLALAAGCGERAAPPAATATGSPAASSTAAPPPAAAAFASGIDMSGSDPNVRIQDDFFQAVNGGWLESTEIPADRARWGNFDILNEKAQEDLRTLVEEVGTLEDVAPGSAAQKIRDYYNAYMDIDRATALGIEAVRAELDAIGKAADFNDFFRLVATLGLNGVNGPVGLFIFSDARDPDTNVVYISESGLTLPDRDYYLEDEERYAKGRDLYTTYVEKLFTAAGIDGGADKAKALLALETRLAEAHWTREANRDPVKSYNPKTAEELSALAPGIEWTAMMDTAGIPPRERYIVSQPSFFEAANDIIRETPLDTWKDYLSFQTIHAFAPIMGEEYFTLTFEFSNKGLQGVEEPRALWKRAVSSVNGNLGELLGQLYVEKHFSPAAKSRMEEMISNLQKAYEQSINGLEWMGEETRAEALRKLAGFTPKIGYPDKWRDYSRLTVEPGDLIGNVKRARVFEHERMVGKLDQPVDKSEWFMTPQTVNAYYNPYWNEIVFPASILQPPFFDVNADDAANYGAIGAAIGHEIGHGFDDQGRKFDGDGNLRDWWTEEDSARFEERKEKLAAQYSSYVVIDDLTINGEFTSGENIGDLGGLSIAHEAYRMSLNGEEAPVIDGYTGDQRFFLGWAQVWRSKTRDEETKRRLTVDPHSPPRFRANGSVTNIPAFYAAFGVKEGDGMYIPPEERVEIW